MSEVSDRIADAAIEESFDWHCRICGSEAIRHYRVREMMHGTREPFHYLECGACGCLQIASIPPDLARFYPRDYYSYEAPGGQTGARVKRAMLNLALMLGQTVRPLERWLERRGGDVALLCRYRRLCPDRRARILDVGAGGGRLVWALRSAGYGAALGIDPFVEADRRDGEGILVRRASLADTEGEWDLIGFNHVLEHMPDQAEALEQAAARLAPAGKILVRVPVVGGEAWRQYGTDWVQLDAPRHLYLHSRSSLRQLAARSGLRVVAEDDDSSALQFWGSELYRRDIALTDPRAPGISAKTMRAHTVRAHALNARHEGDQIAMVLERA